MGALDKKFTSDGAQRRLVVMHGEQNSQQHQVPSAAYRSCPVYQVVQQAIRRESDIQDNPSWMPVCSEHFPPEAYPSCGRRNPGVPPILAIPNHPKYGNNFQSFLVHFSHFPWMFIPYNLPYFPFQLGSGSIEDQAAEYSVKTVVETKWRT